MSRTFFHKLDANALFLCSLFLLAFIPLYPKIPLNEIIPGYQVKIRLEDIFVFLTGLVWLREVWLGRSKWFSLVLVGVVAYAIVGLTSLLFAIGILQTIPFELLHIGKSGLHYFRYLEYFSLFFFLCGSIRTRSQLKISLVVLAVTLVGIVSYGVGQIYWEWPVYSTMNREYSKGVALTLGEFARVHSTFGGHYDLAAYLLLILPIFYALLLHDHRWLRKTLWVALLAAGGWLLLETQAKTSVIGTAVGGLVVTGWWFAHQPRRLQHQLALGGALCLVATLLISVVSWLALPSSWKTTLITKLETNAYGQVILGYFDQSKDRPTDVQHDLPEYRLVATTSATGQTIYTQVVGEREWSPNAIKYGLSMGIRLDTLWPQALRGWANNLPLGNGYATLNKKENAQFTEADSTDNNYLRVLGELGILGVLSFYSVVLWVVYQATRQSHNKDWLIASLSVGFIGASVGLLVNALYIDVFAASKVAFTYWSLAGLIYAAGYLNQPTFRAQLEQDRLQRLGTHLRRQWVIYAALLLLLFLNPANPYAERSFLLNVDTPIRNLRYLLEATGHSPVTSAYGHWLKSWQTFLRHPLSFYYANVVTAVLTVIATYTITKKCKASSTTTALLLGVVVVTITLYRMVLEPVPANLWVMAVMFLIAVIVSLMPTPAFKFKIAPALWAVVGLVIVAIVWKSYPFSVTEWLNHYRHTQLPRKHQVVKRANLYFSAQEFQDTIQLFYYSTLRPEYVSLFQTKEYQPVMYDPDLAQTEIAIRQHITQGRVFLNDYGLAQIANPTLQALNDIFALRMVAIDCQDTCNMYEVTPNQEITSAQPQTLTQAPLRWQSEHTFSIVTQRFDPAAEPPYQTLHSVTELAQQNWQADDFVVFTGDLTHTPDPTQLQLVTRNLAGAINRPLLYLPGNYDTAPLKPVTLSTQHFFADSTYWILFTNGADPEVDEDERLYWYNRLLELEKLPQITQVMIVTTDLDISDPFVVNQLIPRMEAMGEKRFSIFFTNAASTGVTQARPNIQLIDLTAVATPTNSWNRTRIQVNKEGVVLLDP